MKLDLINNVNDREMVMKEENKNKILNILRKLGNVIDYMTEPMVARFFGVEDSTIMWYGNDHSEELSRYGYRVVKGEDLKSLRQSQTLLQISPKTRALRIYPIEAVVVIGMMLTESKVAEQLRSEIISELFGASKKNRIDECVLQLYHGNGGIEAVNTAKELVKLETEELTKERNKAIRDVEERERIINDLLYNVDLAEKRQRINQIVKFGNENVVISRWRLLYGEFNLKYHKDVYKCAKNRGIKVIEYIDQIGMIEELYELSVKLFRTDVNTLLDYWKCIIESSRKED